MTKNIEYTTEDRNRLNLVYAAVLGDGTIDGLKNSVVAILQSHNDKLNALETIMRSMCKALWTIVVLFILILVAIFIPPARDFIIKAMEIIF